MNTAREKEDFPQAMLLSASALLYWLWPLHGSSWSHARHPPTCFSGANHNFSPWHWINMEPLSSIFVSGDVRSTLFIFWKWSDLLHTQLSCYLGSSTLHLNIKAHEKVAGHFKCHFCTALLSRNVATEVLMTKGMSLEKQNLLCAARPTHAHTQNTRNHRSPSESKKRKHFDYCIHSGSSPRLTDVPIRITLLLQTQ